MIHVIFALIAFSFPCDANRCQVKSILYSRRDKETKLEHEICLPRLEKSRRRQERQRRHGRLKRRRARRRSASNRKYGKALVFDVRNTLLWHAKSFYRISLRRLLQANLQTFVPLEIPRLRFSDAVSSISSNPPLLHLLAASWNLAVCSNFQTQSFIPNISLQISSQSF